VLSGNEQIVQLLEVNVQYPHVTVYQSVVVTAVGMFSHSQGAKYA
jgi:hypothetical protein